MRKQYLLFPAMALPILLSAQAPVYLTTVPVTINTGSTFSTSGDVTLQGAVAMHNSGSFVISGNWINNAGIAAINSTLNGTVMMNGNAQSIGGTQSTRFSNLSFTNLAAASKTMFRPVFISSIGRLNSGVSTLALNGQLLTLENPATNAFFGSGSIRHEHASLFGGVSWFATTAGLYSLPFINSSGNTFSFQFQPAIADTVTVGTYATSAANLPYPVLPYNVTHVRNTGGADNSANMVDRFWKLEIAGSNLDATFGYAVNEMAVNGNAGVRAQKWNSPFIAWEAILPGQSNPTAVQVTVPGLQPTPAGGFVWALSMLSAPLPIKLISFTAHATGRREVTCGWITETEVNNDFFTVERSADGFAFEKISSVDGAGNSTDRRYYEDVDKQAHTGISFYRIKQTDFDGRYSYSQAVSVRLSIDGTMSMSIFPNPVSGNVNITLPDDQLTSPLQVISSDGKLVFESANTLLPGKTVNEDFSFLAEGIYYASIRTSAGVMTSKLIVKK